MPLSFLIAVIMIYFLLMTTAGAVLVSILLFSLNLLSESIFSNRKNTAWWLAIPVGFLKLFLQIYLWGTGLSFSFTLSDHYLGAYFWVGYLITLFLFLFFMFLIYFGFLLFLNNNRSSTVRSTALYQVLANGSMFRESIKKAMFMIYYNLFLLFLYSLPFMLKLDARAWSAWIWQNWV